MIMFLLSFTKYGFTDLTFTKMFNFVPWEAESNNSLSYQLLNVFSIIEGF